MEEKVYKRKTWEKYSFIYKKHENTNGIAKIET